MIRSSFLPSAQVLPFPDSQVFLTASQTSAAYSVSVCENVSGEYSYRKFEPCCDCIRPRLVKLLQGSYGFRILLSQFSDQSRMVHRKSSRSMSSGRTRQNASSLYCFLSVVVKYDFTEEAGGSVVHVDDDVFESRDSLERLFDQIRSSRCEDLFPH